MSRKNQNKIIRAPSGNVIELRSLATEWLPVYRNNINSRDRLRSHLKKQGAPMDPNTLFYYVL
jgi:hypothetical protein